MVRPLAVELGTDCIRVDSAGPGVTRTALSSGHGGEALQPTEERAAAKPLGEREDLGDVAVWVSNGAARLVAGQSLLVDGRADHGDVTAWILWTSIPVAEGAAQSLVSATPTETNQNLRDSIGGSADGIPFSERTGDRRRGVST